MDQPVAPMLALPLKKPYKLTPMEKKERDRQRMKQQQQRRKQALKDRYDQAMRLTQSKQTSNLWHQQERMEEELVLRRLERDVVDVQRWSPAAAGYAFDTSKKSAETSTPVFMTYSYAQCPPSQAPRRKLISRGGLQKTSDIQQEATYLHPACHGYSMAKHNDAERVSPIFFFNALAKISLDKIVIKKDDVSDESDEEQEMERTVVEALDGDSGLSDAAKARQQETQRRLKAAMAARGRFTAGENILQERGSSSCFVCKKTETTLGCPGCFSFSSKKYLEVDAAKATQRLKTPKTILQEEDDRRARHKALQKQIIIPPLFPRNNQLRSDPHLTGVKEEKTRPASTRTFFQTFK